MYLQGYRKEKRDTVGWTLYTTGCHLFFWTRNRVKDHVTLRHSKLVSGWWGSGCYWKMYWPGPSHCPHHYLHLFRKASYACIPHTQDQGKVIGSAFQMNMVEPWEGGCLNWRNEKCYSSLQLLKAQKGTIFSSKLSGFYCPY